MVRPNGREGDDFQYHKLSDFETWECFKEAKGNLKKFKESDKCENEGVMEYLVGWVMFTFTNDKQLCRGFIPLWFIEEEENNSNPLPDGGDSAKTGGETMTYCDSIGRQNLNQSRNDNYNSGQNNGENAFRDNSVLNQVANSLNNFGAKGDKSNKSGPTDKHFHSRSSTVTRNVQMAPRDGRGDSENKTYFEVVLKEQDPEIVYPIYKINQKVVYNGDPTKIGVVASYVSHPYSGNDAFPGYNLRFKKKDGGGIL
eukprot:jgi/Psemu1/6718/gm1.6718_g